MKEETFTSAVGEDFQTLLSHSPTFGVGSLATRSTLAVRVMGGGNQGSQRHRGTFCVEDALPLRPEPIEVGEVFRPKLPRIWYHP